MGVIYTIVQKYGVGMILNVFEKYLMFTKAAYSFYSKDSNIVKKYYNLKLTF